MTRDQPVHRPVRTMFTPSDLMYAKSRSHTAGFGSKRNLRCTSEAMYVVPMTGIGWPSRRSQSRETVSFGPEARSFSSFTQKPVVTACGWNVASGIETSAW